MQKPDWVPGTNKSHEFERPGLYYIRNSMKMAVPERNDPCYCGSGKKYKKCHWGERPRFRSVYIGYHEQFGGVQFEEGKEVYVTLPSGILAPADHVVTVTEAENPDGTRKVLNVISDKFAMHLPLYLADNYDVVYAIDTNTKVIAGETVSVGVVVESRFAPDGGRERVIADFRFHGVMLFRNCPLEIAEKFAWWKLLRTLITGPENLAVRTGLITDHDRDGHQAYNRRIAPFYGNVVLPPNVTLHYATTDAATSKGTPDVTNFLLGLCEKRAGEILAQFEGSGSADLDGRVVQVAEVPDVGPTIDAAGEGARRTGT